MKWIILLTFLYNGNISGTHDHDLIGDRDFATHVECHSFLTSDKFKTVIEHRLNTEEGLTEIQVRCAAKDGSIQKPAQLHKAGYIPQELTDAEQCKYFAMNTANIMGAYRDQGLDYEDAKTIIEDGAAGQPPELQIFSDIALSALVFVESIRYRILSPEQAGKAAMEFCYISTQDIY